MYYVTVQFGTPTFSVAMFMGMTAASLCSVIGSVGAYSAVGDICDVSRAPPDAINRALTVSGISNVLAGVFGTGHGYVAFNITVVLIGITKVCLTVFVKVDSLFCSVSIFIHDPPFE